MTCHIQKNCILNPVNGFLKISLTDFPITCATRYRYGANGEEKDDEVKYVRNSLDFWAKRKNARNGLKKTL